MFLVLATVACGSDDKDRSSSGGSGGTSTGGGTSGGTGGGSTGGTGASTSGGAGGVTGGAGGAGGSSGGTAGDGGGGVSAGGAAGNGGAGGAGGAAGSSGTCTETGDLTGSATRPQLTCLSEPNYTIPKYLASGGNMTTGLTTDNWDPTAGVGDVATFTATYTVATSGGTHTSVQEAITAAVTAGGTNRVYIEVKPDTYREVVCVPSAGAPPITLYSTNPDPAQTTIVFDNYSSKPKASGVSANPCNANLTGTTYGTSGAATFAAYSREFHAKNLTFSNDTDETGVTGSVTAPALMTQNDRQIFENVRVLGNQGTLYVKSGNVNSVARSYYKGCYVEGDVDVIMGRATTVLDGCTIKYLTARRGASGGVIVAPATDVRNMYGILIVNSDFTAEAGTPAGTIDLGRAWDESQADLATSATNLGTGV